MSELGECVEKREICKYPKRIAPKLSGLQRNVYSLFYCKQCEAATSYSLLLLSFPHASCYWCASCYSKSPSYCQACGGLYTSEEAAVLASVSQGDCPTCFSSHTCETTCLLCTSAKHYSEHFRRKNCGLCGADVTSRPCQRCSISIRPQNLQLFEGFRICKNCIAEYHPPPALPELSSPLLRSRKNIVELFIVLEEFETPGHETIRNGCQKCGILVSDELFHDCARQEGQSCLWCFENSHCILQTRSIVPSVSHVRTKY